MEYKKIIQDSWEFAQVNKSIMLLYAFLPAVLSAIFTFGFVIYQYISLKHSANLNQGESDLFQTVYSFVTNTLDTYPQAMVPFIVVVAVYLIAYTFIPVLSKGAIVQLAARIRNNQTPKLLSGIGYGFRSFLPLFGFNMFLSIFSLSTIFGYFLMVFRNFSVETTKLFIPVFIILFIVGLIMSFLFAFAENYIIIDDKPIDNSVLASAKLVLENWTETIFVLILMGLIALRVILNMLLIFLIPFGVSVVISFFATINVANLGYILTTALVFIAIYIIGYIGGTFTLFANAVWTFTFLELTGNKSKGARSLG